MPNPTPSPKPSPLLSPATPIGIEDAARRLRAGGLVAFATETVYGLGASALDERAVARIFSAKGRPATNPLIVHAADEAAARLLVRVWTPQAQLLARAFWPGPLTLILPRADNIPDIITAGLDCIGVRVPAHPVALELLRAAGIPIAAPSANRSEGLSPTRAEHVLGSLGAWLDPERDLILDGGPCLVGIESSVLDLTQLPPVLLRPGAVSRAQIEAAIGPIRVPDDAQALIARPDAPRASPGMAARHYAPRARALRFGSRADLRNALQDAPRRRPDLGPRSVGVLALGAFDAPQTLVLAAREMPAQAQDYASRLYAALHELDEAGCQEIWIEMPPQSEEWRAVRDRLRRATAEPEAASTSST